MPWYGMAVWNIITLFLDPKTKSKVHLLKGPSDPQSTEPFKSAPDPENLDKYVDESPTMEMIIGGGVSPVMKTFIPEDEENDSTNRLDDLSQDEEDSGSDIEL